MDFLFWLLVIDILYLLFTSWAGARADPYRVLGIVLGVITLVLAVLRLAGAA